MAGELCGRDETPRTSTCRTWPVTAAAIIVALGVTGCGVTRASRRSPSQPPRARAFVDTFDRILIAGFVADHLSARGHDLDITEEPALKRYRL